VPAPEPAAGLPQVVRDRAIGLAGLFVVAIAVVWAMAGGGAVVTGALVIVGLLFTVVDAGGWRHADLDLAVPEGERLPSPPWGFIVGPAGGLGLVAALLAGAPLVAVVAATALVAALPGAIARLPATPLPYRVAAQARRLRKFVRAHGAAAGEPVPGYLAPVGESGARLFVFAPDGAWGDLMLRPDEPESVARLAQVELAEATDPNAGRKLHIGPQLWESMNRSW
jgi:hypothetical protein